MKQLLRPAAMLAPVAALLMSGCASKMKNFASDYFNTNPNPLEVVSNTVPAVVTGNIPAKVFAKNAVVTVTPMLVYADTEMPYQEVAFQGQDVRGNNTVISYDRGGMMTIPVNYIYMPQMEKSELFLAFNVEQGGKQYVLPRVKVADGVIATAKRVDVGAINPALTPDKFQRIINEKYSADIRFLINQANLRESELQSAGVTDLNRVLNDANADAFREIREINVSSYASPEGSTEFNTRLAENREKNTLGYLNKQLQKDKITEFGELTSQFTAEDWEGFQKLVAASNIQDKDLILSVLSMYKDPQQREQEIRNLASVFDQLADQILPQLRYSRITASIDVIGKSDPEIYRAIDSDPASLSVDEMLYAATLSDDPAWKTKVYKLATQRYPNDFRGWNNLGLMQFEAGQYDDARSSFEQAARLNPNAPEVKMNQGIVSLLNRNYRDANTAFGQAAGVDGLGQALGVYFIEQGDYPAAVRAFGDDKSNNAALAQLLAKDYAKANATLNAIAKPDADTYYLKAVVAARQGNSAAVISNLAQIKKLDPALYESTANDLEFRGYVRP